MKKIITFFAIGNMILAGAFLPAQEQKTFETTKGKVGNYNEAATRILISQAQNGSLTPANLKKLIQKKANINAMFKRTSGNRSKDTLTNLFLESVFFPNPRGIEEGRNGSFNYTPEYMNRQNILTTLVSSGADTSVVDGDGRNAIALAILHIGNAKFREGIVKYLHQNAHVDVNQADKLGATPLMYAIIITRRVFDGDKGVPPLVTYLINKKANLNAADNDGNTALMYAAQYNTLDTVQTLIKLGANLSAKNKQGATAVDFARQNPKILKYLEEKMLDTL